MAYSKFIVNILSGNEILTIRYRCCLSLAMPYTCTCHSKKICDKFSLSRSNVIGNAFTCNRCIQISTKWLLHTPNSYMSCLLYDKYSVIWHLYVNDWNARFLYTNVRLPYLRCASVCVLLNMISDNNDLHRTELDCQLWRHSSASDS